MHARLKNIFRILTVFVLIFSSCKKTSSGSMNPGGPNVPPDSAFARGADISWLTQMEAANITFYNSHGQAQDCMQILKDLGMNSIRLRAWVNPPDGWCNTQDVVAKAVRAKNLGFKIMIDFHYSDSWADPGKQNKPLAWQSENFN